MLKEQEGASEEKAHEVVEQVWRIIEDAAQYMFCCAHSFSMACDSLYAAWLKVHHPYELYLTMLKLYDAKKNKDKLSAIIAEMKRYKRIKLIAGKFGQDNRDWVVDKDNQTISQSLSSIRYMSKQAAKDLYLIGQNQYDTFTDVLRALQMDTCLDTRQIKILIELGYFKDFGRSGKLMKVYNQFFKGSEKLTKSIKSFEARLIQNRDYENSLLDEELDIGIRLNSELNNVGLCLSVDSNKPINEYFVRSVDTKYGVKADLYSVKRGSGGIVRIRKLDFQKKPFEEGDCIIMIRHDKSPRYTYKDGGKSVVPGQYDIWMKEYSVLPKVKGDE